MKWFTLITLLSVILLSSGCHRPFRHQQQGYGHGHGHHTQAQPQSQSYGHRTNRH